MGDRANIVLRETWQGVDHDVFLYTHWNGYQVEQIAADGIREAIAGGRANDPQYGGRIVTDAFLKAHANEPHTGAGISAVIGDGDSHKVVVNFSTQEVTYQVVPEGDEQSREYGSGEPTTVSYEAFLEAFPAKEAAKV